MKTEQEAMQDLLVISCVETLRRVPEMVRSLWRYHAIGSEVFGPAGQALLGQMADLAVKLRERSTDVLRLVTNVTVQDDCLRGELDGLESRLDLAHHLLGRVIAKIHELKGVP